MTTRPPIRHRLITEESASKAPRVRPSKMGKWRALVLISVHVLIALHIAHWLTSGETITPVEPSEAMAFTRSSIINAGLIFFAAMVLVTAVFGRFFCGWGCHLVALQDLCRHLMLKLGITPKPLRSRALAWVPVLAFTYMFIWPAVYRLWVGDSFAIQAVELTTSQFWATFPGWITGILTLLVCGFACVYFLGAKGFCTYACPYGAAFAAADRFAPLRIRVTDACEQCGHCTAVCSSNVRVHEEVRDWGMVVSPGCMKCMDCVSVCPKGALYYGAGTLPLLATPRAERSARPPAAVRWGDEALLVLIFAITFVLVRGLYGAVPFLMALGVAGVVAFFALTTRRLLTEPTVERSGLRLKHGGKLLPQGRLYVAAMVALAVFLSHSALVRSQEMLADLAFDQSASLRRTLLAAPGLQPTLTPELREQFTSGIEHLSRLQTWGLLPTPGTAAKLAWLYALSGAIPDSEQQARQALVRAEIPDQMQQLLAHAALLRGDRIAAGKAWQAAINARPDLPEAYLAWGIQLAQGGEISAGMEVFDRGLAAVPASAELLYNAGLARAIDGQADAAISFFEQALARNPRYLEARENLAGLLASLGRFDASVEHYRIAIAQAPDDAETRVLLARALIGLGHSAEAVIELQSALRLDPTNAEAGLILKELQAR